MSCLVVASRQGYELNHEHTKHVGFPVSLLCDLPVVHFEIREHARVPREKRRAFQALRQSLFELDYTILQAGMASSLKIVNPSPEEYYTQSNGRFRGTIGRASDINETLRHEQRVSPSLV